ncbi:MAG: transglutaminase domain-containing protein [Candidatus Kapabacteria bacterium]|nr:transglutaminase domain-containing protein [Candidatus Kapabacteria bacterium]
MKVKRRELRAGLAGTLDTVDEMKRLVLLGMEDEGVRALAARLKKESRTDVEYYERCHTYVATHIRYKKDKYNGESHEVVTNARHTLVGARPFGDCDDMTIALCTLLKLNRIPCRIKIVAWKKEMKDQYTHVYCMAYMRSLKAWVPADPVRDATIGKSGFGWEIAPVFKRKEFDV